MDALDVVPGRGVAPFLLGAPRLTSVVTSFCLFSGLLSFASSSRSFLGTNIKDIIQFLQRNAGSYGHIISRFNKAVRRLTRPREFPIAPLLCPCFAIVLHSSQFSITIEDFFQMT